MTVCITLKTGFQNFTKQIAMFSSKIQYLKRFHKFQFVPVTFNQFVRNASSTTETLEPVKMSYATFESTLAQNNTSPLIVMHGLFGSKSNWKSLCKTIQKKSNPQRKVIAIDARNHGESEHNEHHTYAHMAADIRALYDQLGIKKAALMGHSMGGRAMMLFTLKYPELVEKLVVIDVSPISTSVNALRIPELLKLLQNLKLPKHMSLPEAMKTVGESLVSLGKNKAVLMFLLTNLVKKDDGSYGWRFNVKALLDNAADLLSFPEVHNSKFTGPVLFLGGGNSDHIQKSDYPKILELFPNAELKYIEGAGHWLHSDKPEEFLKRTIEFLNKEVVTT